MSFREKFAKKKGMLGKQHISQTKNKDSRGSMPSVIKRDSLPAGISTWRCKEGDHLLDILPFYAGPDFPIDHETDKVSVDEGDPAYVLDIMVHNNVGPMKTPYVCPWENFKLPCPICEFMKATRLEVDDWKLVKPSRKTFYLIWCHDTKEEQNKGIQLWEISHFSMEEKLSVIASLPKGGGAIEFAHPDEGMSVAFLRKGAGAKNTQYLGHRFVPREIKIPEKLLDMTFPVDSVIKMHPTYEEIETAFKGQKSQIGASGDSEETGSNFDKGSSSSTDDGGVPAWMGGDDETPAEPKKTAPRKILRRKK